MSGVVDYFGWLMVGDYGRCWIVLGKRRNLKNQDGIREGYKGMKVKNFSKFKVQEENN
jgi:hypothetical protein